MKSTIFISTLIASAFTLATAGKNSKSYSTKGYSSRYSKTDCSSSSSSSSSDCSSSSSSSCSSSSSSSCSSSDSSSSSDDEKCGPQFKIVRKYGRWCDYAKACHKERMVPAKITSRNIYSAVRAIRKSKHKSAWIKSWNTDPYKGNLVLTVPDQKCDGPGSITVACKGIKKVALCMRKKDDYGDCKDKKYKKKKSKKHGKKYRKSNKSRKYRKSRKSRKSCSSSDSSSSSSSSSTSDTSSSSCPAVLKLRRPVTAKTTNSNQNSK